MNSPLLGVDLGWKRTGLALSENGLLARPLSVVETKPPHMQPAVQAIVEQTKQHQVQTIVIGLPNTEADLPTTQANKVTQVIKQLEQALAAAQLSPTIVTVNEFHTTLDARHHFPDTPVDAAAAALILQDYLDQPQ